MATSQHLLHITYLHSNNDTVPEKGSSELHENSITIIIAATTAKQSSMKNRIRTPNLMVLHKNLMVLHRVDIVVEYCFCLVAKNQTKMSPTHCGSSLLYHNSSHTKPC